MPGGQAAGGGSEAREIERRVVLLWLDGGGGGNGGCRFGSWVVWSGLQWDNLMCVHCISVEREAAPPLACMMPLLLSRFFASCLQSYWAGS
jgi:hypothetical protein